MKATIKWRRLEYIPNMGKYGHKIHFKTLTIEKNEPNHIVNKARDSKILTKDDYILTIKCGRYEYQWFGYPNY